MEFTRMLNCEHPRAPHFSILGPMCARMPCAPAHFMCGLRGLGVKTAGAARVGLSACPTPNSPLPRTPSPSPRAQPWRMRLQELLILHNAHVAEKRRKAVNDVALGVLEANRCLETLRRKFRASKASLRERLSDVLQEMVRLGGCVCARVRAFERIG
jgi:hypothetical protein